MKPAPFRYHAPRTVTEATALLDRLEDAKIIAGGQSLMPLMNFRLTGFEDLIDIGRIPELVGINVGSDRVTIGAATRQRQVERSTELRERFPIIVEALENVGHPQTRNRGTVGGSIAHLDPTAELVAVASVTDAVLHVRSHTGSRQVSIHDFIQMAYTTDLEPDELLVAVEFPLWPAGHGYAFEEFARRHGDFAVVAVAVLVTLAADGTIERLAISVAGMTEIGRRATEVEEALVGRTPDAETIRAAAQLTRAYPALTDLHGPPAYRQHLLSVLTERAVTRACARAERS